MKHEPPTAAEKETGNRLIASNRQARHDYDVLESIEAGLVLTGTEIKSVRTGRVNLREAYARPERGEIWLWNMHIAPYAQGNQFNHDPLRKRKLLLHRAQISRLAGLIGEKGLTLVPLRLYITRDHAKVELAAVRGRKLYDKRAVIAKRDAEREIARGAHRTGPSLAGTRGRND